MSAKDKNFGVYKRFCRKVAVIGEADLEKIVDNLKIIRNYITSFLKWILLSVLVGALGGTVGSVFHLAIDRVTEYRMENSWIINLLPIGGIVIALLYTPLYVNSITAFEIGFL